MDRTLRAIDRGLDRLAEHEVPRPLRRVVPRYLPATRDYRRALHRAILAGRGDREVRALLLAADRAFQRWEGAQTDVEHLA